jgi:hypothetical protein
MWERRLKAVGRSGASLFGGLKEVGKMVEERKKRSYIRSRSPFGSALLVL